MYLGRRIAQTMHWMAADWLTRTEREREESTSVMIRELGVKPGMCVRLLGAPASFEETLGALPEGAMSRRRGGGPAPVVLFFAPDRAKFLAGWAAAVAALAEGGRLWICWPKKAGGLVTDQTQADVRNYALAKGLVDFKVCAVDADWSGLAFARRKD